mmetsp:Transcript_63236/g.176839  ORF Transcript_63236/g.176839 Transcript_63236/m.176839 type:complete len:205 (+) Transcript_63236:431-1045(+)
MLEAVRTKRTMRRVRRQRRKRRRRTSRSWTRIAPSPRATPRRRRRRRGQRCRAHRRLPAVGPSAAPSAAPSRSGRHWPTGGRWRWRSRPPTAWRCGPRSRPGGLPRRPTGAASRRRPTGRRLGDEAACQNSARPTRRRLLGGSRSSTVLPKAGAAGSTSRAAPRPTNAVDRRTNWTTSAGVCWRAPTGRRNPPWSAFWSTPGGA